MGLDEGAKDRPTAWMQDKTENADGRADAATSVINARRWLYVDDPPASA